ncbi:MAG: RodZ domain-containing protein [Fidelibacterota bacterium]
MNEFFKDLKEKRQSQNIELEEIHSRTKINIDYLTAIEEGQFEILPLPYVRLFLRAYVVELGGDPDEALHQLDIFQASKEGRRIPKKPVFTKEASIDDQKDAKLKPPSHSRPPTKIREDLIKGVVLLIIFLFAIFIIKKINSEDSAASLQNGEIVLTNNPAIITDDILTNDYVEAVSQTVAMTVTFPFKMKIISDERIWYSVKIDTSTTRSGILPPGEEYSLPFDSKFHIRLNQTAGTTLYINGVEVDELGDYSHPADIEFISDPSTVTVKHYIPQR